MSEPEKEPKHGIPLIGTVDGNEFLSPEEAATLMGVSRIAVYTNAQRGKFQTYVFKGKLTLYRRTEIEQWNRTRRKGPGEKAA